MKKDGIICLMILLLTAVLFISVVFFAVSRCTNQDKSYLNTQEMAEHILSLEEEITFINILPQLFIILENTAVRNLAKNKNPSQLEEDRIKWEVIWDPNSWSIIVKQERNQVLK